jgi:hypothetical protein
LGLWVLGALVTVAVSLLAVLVLRGEQRQLRGQSVRFRADQRTPEQIAAMIAELEARRLRASIIQDHRDILDLLRRHRQATGQAWPPVPELAESATPAAMQLRTAAMLEWLAATYAATSAMVVPFGAPLPPPARPVDEIERLGGDRAWAAHYALDWGHDPDNASAIRVLLGTRQPIAGQFVILLADGSEVLMPATTRPLPLPERGVMAGPDGAPSPWCAINPLGGRRRDDVLAWEEPTQISAFSTTAAVLRVWSWLR